VQKQSSFYFNVDYYMEGSMHLFFWGAGGGRHNLVRFVLPKFLALSNHYWKFWVCLTLLNVYILYFFSLVNVLVYIIRDRRFRKNAVDFLFPRSL